MARAAAPAIEKQFTNMQVLCIHMFPQNGLGSENCTGLEPQAVIEGDKKRTNSEANGQRSDTNEQK